MSLGIIFLVIFIALLFEYIGLWLSRGARGWL